MSAPCDHFELDITMRHHDALPPAEAAMLDAHLGGCRSCSAFEATLHGFAATIDRRVHADVMAMDWDRMHARVRQLRRNYLVKLWLAPLFVLQLPISFLLARGELPPAELLVIVAPANVAIYAAYVWLVSRPYRLLVASTRSGQELLAGYERELRRQRLRARIFAVVNTLLAIACVHPLLFAPDTRLRLYALGCVVFFAAWAAYDLLRRLPRLRAALAEVRR